MIFWKLPNIIPKYRYWSAFIGLILASSIFVGTFTLIYSLNNASDDIFGISDDVLVYYNQEATTPFTSQIPEDLAASFEQVKGVKLANPEIFQPVIINGKTAYIRGSDYTNFIKLEELNLVAGRIPDKNQYYQGMMGIDLANRLDIKINDIVKLNSIKEDQLILIRVTGIYQSSSITNDELIINLQLSRTIAGFDDISVTHIRVKFNNQVSSKELILTEALKTHQLSISTDFGNSTRDIEDYEIQVINSFERTIYSSPLSQILELQLLKDNYKIIIQENKTTIKEIGITIVEDQNLLIDLSFQSFTVLFEFKFQDIPIPDTNINIINNLNQLIKTEKSNSIGQIEINLERGKYSLEIKEGLSPQIHNFTIIGPLEQTIELDYLSYISITDFYDGILFPRNEFRIEIANITNKIGIYIDDEFKNLVITDNFKRKLAFLNISNGAHRLEIRQLNSQKVIYSFQIRVDNTFELLKIDNFVHYSHYAPNQEFTVDLEGINLGTLDSNVALTIINQSLGAFVTPNSIGFYALIISGTDTTGFELERRWDYVIENNPADGGWQEASNNPIVKSGDVLNFWIKIEDENLTSNNGILGIENGLHTFTIPILPEGNYQSIINSSQLNFNLQYQVVNSYFEYFKINTISTEYSFNISTSINASYFDVKYDDGENSNFEEFWLLSVNSGFGFYNVYQKQNISVPGSATNQSIEFRLISKLSNQFETKTMFFVDNQTEVDFAQLKQGYPSIDIDGIISLFNLQNEILNFSIAMENDYYVPFYLNENTLQLKPGNYSIKIFNNITSLSYNWELEIPIWSREYNFDEGNVSYPWGSLSGTNIHLLGGIQFSNGILGIHGSIRAPEKVIFRNTETSTVIVEFTNIIAGQYQLLHSNGTSSTLNLTSNFIEIKDDNSNNVTISVNGINLNEQPAGFTVSVQLGPQLNNYQINFLNTSGFGISELHIDLFLNETRQQFQFDIDNISDRINFETSKQMIRLVITNGNQTIQLLDLLLTNQEMTIDIYLGTPTIRFNIANANLKTNSTTGVITISEINNLNNKQTISVTDIIQLQVGNYNFEFSDQSYSGSRNLFINQSQILKLDFDILFSIVTLEFVNIPFGSPFSLNLNHLNLNYSNEEIIASQIRIITLVDIPIGPYNITLVGNWGERSYLISILPEMKSYIISLNSNINDATEIIDLRIAEKIENLSLGSSVGGAYLNQFLEGSLVIAQIILISEILLIFIIVVTNIIEIFAAIAVESKNEILIMKDLGSSTSEIVYASTKFLLLNSILIAIIGQVIGGLVLDFLLQNNFTVYFGHLFHPELFVLEIFIGNLVLIIIIMFSGAYISVKREVLNKSNHKYS